MTSNLLGIIIGGLLPALFYGVSSVFAKSSTNAGMSIGGHLFFIGIAISITGMLFHFFWPGDNTPSLFAVISSSMQGIFWGLGTGCVVLGLLEYKAPLAKLVPLYNMNTLITSGLALIIFAEWREVSPVTLFAGTCLIIAGGVLVSRA